LDSSASDTYVVVDNGSEDLKGKSIESLGTVTASNGLTKTDGDVKLGGALTEDTLIVVGRDKEIFYGIDADTCVKINEGAELEIVENTSLMRQSLIDTYHFRFSNTATTEWAEVRWLDDSFIEVRGSDSAFQGINYYADYSANFTDRSLVDKSYVDNLTQVKSFTTTEQDALTPVAGMLIYNSTTNKHRGYNGTIWNDLY